MTREQQGPLTGDELRTGRVLFAHRSQSTPDPDITHDLPKYREWVDYRQGLRLAGPPQPGPELMVVLVVDRPVPGRLRQCLAALAAQTSERWRLSVTVLGPLDDEAATILDTTLAAFAPGRVLVRSRPDEATYVACVAGALEESDTPACVLIGQYDQLVSDGLAQLAAALLHADVAYGDEDQITDQGLLVAPMLKPDWSPELALAWCYPGLPLALRIGPLVAAGGIAEVTDGDPVHDLLLRITERTSQVAHVAEILCHHPADQPVAPAGPGAVLAALARAHQEADVAPGPLPGSWSIRRHLAAPVQVSAIVPFRDSTRLLRTCADTLRATAGQVDLELILVDNGSIAPETLTLMEQLARRPGVTVLHDPRPFNWAALNNAAVEHAHGPILLFVNDDVEAIDPGWLELMAAQALRPEVGAVGARLLYPDGRLQHAGVVVGMGGGAAHVLAGVPADQAGYLGMAGLTRDVSAVTGACLATRRDVFDRLGRFTETLGIDLNDIDYCLRAHLAGLRVVYEAGASLIHYESPSRGTSANMADIARFVDRWERFVSEGDPYLNRHLTRTNRSPRLVIEGEDQHWEQWKANLDRETSTQPAQAVSGTA